MAIAAVSGMPCEISPFVPRRFRGQRALNVAVRTAHIASAGIVLGAATFDVAPGRWVFVAGGTGLLLLLDEVYRYGAQWVRFAQCWVLAGKLALLWWGLAHPAYLAWALWAAVIAGGVIAHAPGSVRQYAFWGEPGPCATKHALRVVRAEHAAR